MITQEFFTDPSFQWWFGHIHKVNRGGSWSDDFSSLGVLHMFFVIDGIESDLILPMKGGGSLDNGCQGVHFFC